MKAGIVPNLSKQNIYVVLTDLIKELLKNGIAVLLQKNIISKNEIPDDIYSSIEFLSDEDFFTKSDVILSVGGDGTMLHTAYEARKYDVPLAGINIGKLGFLAEVSINELDKFILDVKSEKFYVEERMTLKGCCTSCSVPEMFAVNDIVIDKGMWPKMIELTIQVDDEYVSTFAADGVIIATPTGSTGYSLSTGGPIVFPKSNSIIISPIAPHSLTMRPLVLSCSQNIKISVKSQSKSVQVNCDGQRVHQFETPTTIEIMQSDRPMKLLHTNANSYFEILREKLLWGLDVRKNNGN